MAEAENRSTFPAYSFASSRTKLVKAVFGIINSVDFWYLRISRRATTPGRTRIRGNRSSCATSKSNQVVQKSQKMDDLAFCCENAKEIASKMFVQLAAGQRDFQSDQLLDRVKDGYVSNEMNRYLHYL
eukprot:gene26410-28927_t